MTQEQGSKLFGKAYSEGVAAHINGQPSTANPYPDLNKEKTSDIQPDPLHGGWNTGWVERDIVVNG